MKKKVAIIGASEMGTKLAYSLAMKARDAGKPLHITLYNRNIDLAHGEVEDLQNALTALKCNYVTVQASNNIRHLAKSNVVALTAGASWATLQTGSRDAELPFTTDIALTYGKAIRRYCPDAFVMVVTNPVDIITWFVKEHSFVPAHKIIGIGVACDSVRYQEAIKNELRKRRIYVKEVEGFVLGSHHGSDMVMLPSSVTVNKKPLRSLVESGKLTEQELTDLLSAAEELTYTEGGEIAKAKRSRTASTGPAEIMAMASMAYLFDKGVSLPASRFIEEKDHDKYGISDVCVGVLTYIDALGAKLENIKMTKKEQEKWNDVAKKNQSTKAEIGDGSVLKKLAGDMKVMLENYQNKLNRNEEMLTLYREEFSRLRKDSLNRQPASKINGRGNRSGDRSYCTMSYLQFREQLTVVPLHISQEIGYKGLVHASRSLVKNLRRI